MRSFAQPRFDELRERIEVLTHDLLFALAKIAKHVVGEVATPRRILGADADAKTRVFLRTDPALDAFQAVVPARRAAGAHAKAARGERDLVDDDEQVA